MFKNFAATLLLFSSVTLVDASTLSLGQATGYNLFALSSFSPTGSEALGNVAASSLSAANVTWTLGDASNTNRNLIVGQNLTLGTLTVYGGTVLVQGNATLSAGLSGGNALKVNVYGKGTFTAGYETLNGGITFAGIYKGPSYSPNAAYVAPNSPAPIDFAAAQADLAGVSSALSGVSANGAVTASGGGAGLVLTGTDGTRNVFSLTSTQLSAALANGSSGITVNVPSGATVIINVNGSSVNITGSKITLNGASRNSVLWNFPNASVITYTGVSWQGSILATAATFTGSNGNVEGQLIASVVSGSTEFHDFLFTGSLPATTNLTSPAAATPEPSTWMMSLTGLAFFGYLARKKLDWEPSGRD